MESPATQRNIARLIDDGVVILGPAAGDQACGEVGLGRILEADDLFEDVISHFQAKLLAGRRVLLTAGPTFEPIDQVRGVAAPVRERWVLPWRARRMKPAPR